MIQVLFTQEELKAVHLQLRMRVDSLENTQVTIAKSGDVKKVLELEETLKVLRSAHDKICRELSK